MRIGDVVEESGQFVAGLVDSPGFEVAHRDVEQDLALHARVQQHEFIVELS
ncbi:MAG: hypothetical protein CM1200mP2_00800 [Planctomycetaceae bacterium]|nr:MAG: hypothetical protein CM1200mP2_00800 [Planctomycetaceae bacterium]